MKWTTVRTSIEVDEDQSLASSVRFDWEEAIGGLIEAGYVFETWCFDERSGGIVGPAMIAAP